MDSFVEEVCNKFNLDYKISHQSEPALWEEMISRVENGEHIGIENENGNKAVMIPADDELIRIHTELNNFTFLSDS